MLSPDKEYYVPKNADEVAFKIVELMLKSDEQAVKDNGGLQIFYPLRDYLELGSALTYSAIGIWLYNSTIPKPRFLIETIQYIEDDHSFNNKLQLFQNAYEPIKRISSQFTGLVKPIGSNISMRHYPIDLGYSSLQTKDPNYDSKVVTEQYKTNFNWLADWTFGKESHPNVGDNRDNKGIFLGGTIAFTDPYSI